MRMETGTDIQNAPTRQDIDGFCRTHWTRLCALARYGGLDEHESQDAVQDLFMRLLQRDQLIAIVQMPSPDHQRAILATRLRWDLSNRRRNQHRLCRGGGVTFVSISDDQATVPEPSHHHTPDRLMSIAWVNEALENAFSRLRHETKPAVWNLLEPALRDSERQARPQPIALRVALHRARQRLRSFLSLEVDGSTSPQDAAAQLLGSLDSGTQVDEWRPLC